MRKKILVSCSIFILILLGIMNKVLKNTCHLLIGKKYTSKYDTVHRNASNHPSHIKPSETFSLQYENKTIVTFSKRSSLIINFGKKTRKAVKSGLQGVNSAQLTELKWDYVWQWNDKGGGKAF